MDEIRNLERQILEWANDVAEQIPAYEHGHVAIRLHAAPPKPSRTHRVVVGAVAVLVLVGGVVAYRQQRRSANIADRTPVSVRYERVEYRQQVECDRGAPKSEATFNEAVFEAWGDDRRWRNIVTYPDGSTRDVIATDNPFYPKSIYTRGEIKGTRLRCAGDDTTLAAEPGQGSFYSLNRFAAVPSLPNAFTTVSLCYDSAKLVDGTFTDSRLRPALLRREIVKGFVTYADGLIRPITQTIQCFIDPSSELILEKTFTEQVDGHHNASWSATMTDTTTTEVTNAFYSTAGYKEIPTEAPPSALVPTTTLGSPPSTVSPGTAEPPR